MQAKFKNLLVVVVVLGLVSEAQELEWAMLLFK